MRRALPLLIGGVVGALVAVVVGWLVLRPADGDLVAAAHELVPQGYTVQGEGVDEGNALIGWPDVAGVRATNPDGQWQDVSVPDLATAAGWELVDHEPSDVRSWSMLHRPGLTARLTLRSDGGEAEAVVTVERDGTGAPRLELVALGGGLVGALLGALVGRGLSARRESR